MSRQGHVAMLIVNGDRNPGQGRWLELCLDKVREHTVWPAYRMYVWNNDPDAGWIGPCLQRFEKATLVGSCPPPGSTSGASSLNHALALQRLYEQAAGDDPRYIMTLDNDAHPVRSGWLTELVSALEDGAGLAGVWRDEMVPDIAPYVHPSCLILPHGVVRREALRFDCLEGEKQAAEDTLSSFTRQTRGRAGRVHKLCRSNARNFHRVMGGVYGDLVYHHGAGSRPRIHFRGDPFSNAAVLRNGVYWDVSTRLLFEHYDAYLGWLRGRLPPAGAQTVAEAVESAFAAAEARVLRELGWRGRCADRFHRAKAALKRRMWKGPRARRSWP